MMDWLEILKPVIALVITWLIGLFMNKPGYKKAKNVNAVLAKSLEDNKISPEEVQAIIDAFKTVEK